MVRDLEDAWAAVLRPTLVDFRGGAWFLSTPKGLNYFKRLFDRGNDPGRRTGRPGRCPPRATPTSPRTRWTTAGAALPERTFVQEFEAGSWRTSGAVFRRVLEARHRHPAGRGRSPGHRYAIGVDWAPGATSPWPWSTPPPTSWSASTAATRWSGPSRRGACRPWPSASAGQPAVRRAERHGRAHRGDTAADEPARRHRFQYHQRQQGGGRGRPGPGVRAGRAAACWTTRCCWASCWPSRPTACPLAW